MSALPNNHEPDDRWIASLFVVPGDSVDEQPQARVAPVPAARQRPDKPVTTGKFVAAAVGLTGLLAGAVVLGFIALQVLFPWLSTNSDTPAEAAAAVGDTNPVRAVGDGTVSPAEKVVDAVLNTKVSSFDRWDRGGPTESISSPSLGFGCDPKDGLSPVVAKSRTWTDGRSAVTVSVRAYPAGGGAVAIEGISEAAVACEAASTDYASVDVGVEAVEVRSPHLGALLWRRGDVLVLATLQDDGRAVDPAVFADPLKRFDATLDRNLDEACLDEEAGLVDAQRSPYLGRKAYRGHHVTEKVDRPESAVVDAEDRTTDPVVPIPAPPISQPYAPERPAVPNPLPTTGPTALPREVLPAIMPEAPVRPDEQGSVQRQVEDVEGPGCGWLFTQQAIPVFDPVRAQTDYDRALAKTERRLNRDWSRWQSARLAYWKAYAAYLTDAERYNAYSSSLSKVAAAWRIIEDARDVYYTSLNDYQIALDELRQWRDDRAAARQQYVDDKAACAAQPTPTADPSATPTPGVDDTPDLVCPPVRPGILDETPPPAPTSPTPAPEAQLP